MPLIPIGGNSTVSSDQQFQTDLVDILTQMSAKGDLELAKAFQSYAEGFHKQYPGYTAQQALSAFVGTELAKSLGAGISGTGTVLGQVPGAAAKGAGTAIHNLSNPIDLIGSFAVGNWFLRIGEILLGLVLIGVGVARITGVQNAISKATKTVIK